MKREWSALIFAMTFPTLMTWFYFVVLAPSPLPLSPGGRGQGEGAQAPSQTKDASVEVKVVKYDGLKEAVTNLKGSLVVVDFWSTT